MLGAALVPRFAPGVKFRFDAVRGNWVLLAPERLFQPDESATEVLKLIDARRSVGEVVDVLAERFQAPRETIMADVSTLLEDLAAKGALRL